MIPQSNFDALNQALNEIETQVKQTLCGAVMPSFAKMRGLLAALMPFPLLTPEQVRSMAEKHGWDGYEDGNEGHWYVVGLTDCESHHGNAEKNPAQHCDAQSIQKLTPEQVNSMAEKHGIDGTDRHWYVVGLMDYESHRGIAENNPAQPSVAEPIQN